MAGRGQGRRRLAAAGLALLAAGCGGSAASRKPFTVSLAAASFPADQRVATAARLRIAVRNDDSRALPDVAVSIDSFAAVDPNPGLGSPLAPVWLVDRAPGASSGSGAGSTADETWALGPLAPGATASFVWRVTPVRAGTYRVAYRASAGDAGGGALAALADGRPVGGAFTVRVSGAAADPRVDPITGRVVRRAPRLSAGAGAG